jgi:hypothetical protein
LSSCGTCGSSGYALLCAPRHLSWWSDAHLLLTLGYENALTFVLINLLWIYPQLLMAVMWPTFRSSSKSKVSRNVCYEQLLCL